MEEDVREQSCENILAADIPDDTLECTAGRGWDKQMQSRSPSAQLFIFVQAHKAVEGFE